MKDLVIRCRCGHNLAACRQQPVQYLDAAGAELRPWMVRDPSSGQQRLRPEIVELVHPSGMAAPDRHPLLVVVARKRVKQRHYPPDGPLVVNYRWTCPDCGDTPTLRGERIGALYWKHRSDPRRAVHIVVGTDI